MERMALKVADARYARQLGAVQRTAGERDEAGTDNITAIGADMPAALVFAPAQLLDPGLKQRTVIQVKVPANGAAVFENLRRVGVLFFRYVTEFFQ